MINLAELERLVAEVDAAEANNMEETTRDERHWMRQASYLATELLRYYGRA